MRTGGLWLAAIVIAGCGSDGVSSEPFELIGRDWTVGPGTETYKCIGIYADQDMYIHGFQTENPLGEHHAVITTADAPGGLNNTQVGEHDCDVSTLDLQMLFASGVGTDKLTLPDGVALPIKKGQFIHLHQHATYQKMMLTRAGTTTMIHDAAFDFREQVNYPLSPTLSLKTGDNLRTECTYTNTGSTTLTWGDSSTAEMCFTGLYVYPAAGSVFGCVSGL